MTYKYQLIFLGDIKNDACNAIKVRFFEKIQSIGPVSYTHLTLPTT